MGWRGAEPSDRSAGGSAHPNALGLLAGVQPLVLYQRSRLAALLLVRAAHLPVDDLVSVRVRVRVSVSIRVRVRDRVRIRVRVAVRVDVRVEVRAEVRVEVRV